MTLKERSDIQESLFEECRSMMTSKGADYASPEDSLANFKRNAKRLGLTKYQVWAVYFGKHIDAIFNAIKKAPASAVEGTASEPLRGRIVDAMTYLAILEALMAEDQFEKEAVEVNRFLEEKRTEEAQRPNERVLKAFLNAPKPEAKIICSE